MKGFAVVTAIALLLPLAATAQDPQPPRSTFKSAVDLVPVDVSVIDKSGRPVSDLSAQDFTLAVDGKPRRIASTQFISVERAIETAPPKPVEYSSNAGSAGARLIMLVVDAGNIGLGRGKPAIEAAQRFIAGLNRADRLALVTIPGAGPQIDFTSNHALVRTLLNNVVGQAIGRSGPQRVGLSEALAIERGDQNTIDDVIDRECSADPTTASRQACLQQLAGESGQLLSLSRERTRNSMIALRYLFEHVAASETPKTMVFLSEGLLLDREQSDIAWVASRAAAAHITLYVLQLDSPEMEAFARTTSPSRGSDRETLRQGLEQLAGMARGDVFRIVANPDFAFQRLALELSGYYLLSFEPEPGDRDGKPHKIRIDVRRKDLLLRSRREFTVGAPASRTAADTLLEALRGPLLAADLPLKLTTYTFQDPDSPRLKVILVADIDRSLNPAGRLSLGYTMVDDKGRLISSQIEEALTTPIDPRSRMQKYIGAAIAPPGTYTLKLAVVDDGGKRGSVERTFTAKINGFGQLHVTDLLIADDTVRGSGGLPPAVAADFVGGELHAYVELFSEAPDQLRNATVAMEIARSEDARALDSVPARFQAVAAPHRRVAEAGVPIALLPAGDYVARAVIYESGRKVGQVVRPFRIARPADSTSSPTVAAAPLAPAAPIPFAARTDRFDTAAVLARPVLGFFLDRMSAAAAAGAAPLRPAMASVLAGRYEEALRSIGETADDRLAATFLKGIVDLSRGDAGAAADRFASALRADPQFYSAAFYLGASQAAAGDDREAAKTWQASLITDPAAPFVYTVLGDALLRLRDADRAIDVLAEARTLWPADDQVAQRLSAALVAANKPADAMRVLEPYLAAHPADHERLLLALRALYEARAGGRSVRSPAEDRALFDRYADAYAAAGGPERALVEQWRRTIDRHEF